MFIVNTKASSNSKYQGTLHAAPQSSPNNNVVFLPASQEIPRILWTLKLHIVFTTASYLSLSWAKLIQFTPSKAALPCYELFPTRHYYVRGSTFLWNVSTKLHSVPFQTTIIFKEGGLYCFVNVGRVAVFVCIIFLFALTLPTHRYIRNGVTHT
jgi:hypothetical protein